MVSRERQFHNIECRTYKQALTLLHIKLSNFCTSVNHLMLPLSNQNFNKEVDVIKSSRI